MKRRSDGRYGKSVYIDGKRKMFYSTETTEKKALIDIEQQMINFKNNQYDKKHNFNKIAERMLETKEKTSSGATVQCYKYALMRAKISDDINIEDINANYIQLILNSLARENYSFSAVHKTKVAIGLVFDYAIVEENLQINNFIKSVKLPKSLPKPTITHPNDIVIKKIFKYAETAFFGLWAISALCTGCRRGELNALQVKDINWKEKTISITKSTAFPNNQPILKSPKSKASIGKVPILDVYIPYLKKIVCGKNINDFLFGGKKPLTKIQIRRNWDKFCDEIGEKFREHQLRHAYALILYRSGVPAKQAQSYLRHANYQITMDIYTGFDNEYSDTKVNPINNYLNDFLTQI